MSKDEEIVRIKREDLQALLDANTEAYNILDNILTYPAEVDVAIKTAHTRLEEAPMDMGDLIVPEPEPESEQP